MKKLLSLMFSLSLSAALLAGCSSSGESDASQTSSDAGSPASSQSAATEALDVNVMALKGPTAIGMVKMMEENESLGAQVEAPEEDAASTGIICNFTITAMPDEVSAALAQETADIAAVPANLASVLYSNTDGGVQVLAINTLGMLYIVESGDSVQSMEDLRGKTIYASGKGGTPEYALNHVLIQNGIDPVSDVSIEWKSEHAECLAALTAQENAVAMLPQPFVTTAQSKSDRIRVALDLTEEWNKLQADSTTPSTLVTGVVVARTAFVEAHPEAVSAFLDQYASSVEFVNTHVEDAAQLVGSYEIVTAEVAQKAIPACNIVFIEGSEMKDKLSGYLTVLFDQNAKSVGGALPADDFYYSR